MIQGAIFDVDGTLLDSMPIWDTLANDYLRSLRIEPRENLAEVFKTFSLSQSAKYYQDVYGVTLSEEEIIAGLNQVMEDFYRFQAPLKPGVKEFLHSLQESGVKLCIATATDRPLIEAALERCGVLSLFSRIFTCGEVGHSKNQPDIYRKAQEYLGTPKENTWVFEDAFHGANTAKKDGFPVAAVFDPSESQQAELKEVADIYMESFAAADIQTF